MSTGLYAGTTLTDDGSPILLLDIAGIARIGGLVFDAEERAARLTEAPADQTVEGDTVLLFIGLDGRRRAIRMAVVGRIDEVTPDALQFGASGPRAVIDDRLFPLAGATETILRGDLADDKVRLFRLSDGTHEIAYALSRVIDIKTLDSAVLPASTPGEIEGVTLIDGEPAELVDAHWLFARTASEPAARQPVCRLATDDPWLQNFLRPLVEVAGYRIVGDGDDSEADIAIGMEEDPATLSAASAVIRLRSSREGRPDAPDSVYRYDRDGLIAAFTAARRRIAS
jgi:two-component system chemotaxis sensor kinase CheA